MKIDYQNPKVLKEAAARTADSSWELPADHPAMAAVRAIIADLTDRRGLRQEWEQIDADIRKEILTTWAACISIAFEQAGR